MDGSPAEVEPATLKELGIRLGLRLLNRTCSEANERVVGKGSQPWRTASRRNASNWSTARGRGDRVQLARRLDALLPCVRDREGGGVERRLARAFFESFSSALHARS